MTRISSKSPGEAAAAHFAARDRRVNAAEPGAAAREFHAASESVKEREAAQEKAAAVIKEPEVLQKKPVDPGLRYQILSQTGIDIAPDPKP